MANTSIVGVVPVNLAGDTMSGYLVLNADPVAALGAVTKQYADAIAAGFTVKTACVVSATANLTATYANGAAGVGATLTNSGAMAAFSADGVSPSLNDRVLVPFQTSTLENGIYELTTVGSGAANWVLTRTTDYDETSEVTPGSFVPVTMGTLYSQTSWIQTNTVGTIGVDAILFSQFTASPNTFAVTALSNLASVAINESLISDTDITDDLGTGLLRWNNIFSATLKTGTTAGNTLVISARDVDGAADTPFITLTANNTPTCVLASGVTGTTQSQSDNSTKLATTAYADTLGAAKANVALDNLAAVAINTSLISDTDNTDNLGSGAIRWASIFAGNLNTGTVAGNQLKLQAYDADGAAYTTFATLTANNTPTMSLSGDVTSVTQSASDNSTKIATTAYADAQATSAASTKANVTLNNLTTTAINTDLISDTDVTDDLGSLAVRWDGIFAQTLNTGDTATDTLKIRGYDVDGATFVDFVTVTANNTPTCVFSGDITSTTQTPLDNSTKLATTAYVDAATGGGSGANVSLSNLSAVAINTSLISDTDVTDNLGSQAIRWNNIYGATLQTGDTAADTLKIGAWDVDGAALTTFVTLTANNTPTCALSGDVTGVTQSGGDNSTKLATTAYVDAIVGGANTALSNLAAVAINTTLVSDTDATDDLGAPTIRWKDLYATNIKTGTGAGNTTILSARDVDGAADTTFITLTANNTPTCVLASAVTGTTQSASDNSTKLATTAYADAQVVAIAANKALSNLASVAVNTTLVSDTDVTDNLGTQAIRWNNVYAATVQTGDTAADTLQIGAWDVDGAAFSSFITLTANNTPTCVLASGVTATTQSASDNSTKLATTAYVDSAISGGSGKILQVVTTNLPGTFTTTSTSYTDLTGMSVSITPSSSSSRVMILVQLNTVCGGSIGNAVQLVRDSTAINLGTAASNRTVGSSSSLRTSETGSNLNVGLCYVDSPATTSATTYKLQVICTQAGTLYVNRTVTDSDTAVFTRVASTITVMEIGP